MTQIHFERTGGFAGLRMEATIQLDSLPEQDAQTLKELLEEADFFNLAGSPFAHPAPDEFNYTVTVEETHRRHTIHTTDTTAPDSLQALLSELSRQARSQKR